MPKPSPKQNAAALDRRAEFLVSHLGFDPRESMTFRAVTSVLPLVGTSLAADPAAALAMINSSPYVKEPQTIDTVYSHTIEAASTRRMADRFASLSARTVANIADDCKRGISFMTKHAVGGMFAGVGENPYGRTFAGEYEQRADVTRALAQFYMLRAHNPNGTSLASTDDLHRGLVGGTLFDFSIGLTAGGLDLRTCDVCGNEIFSLQCAHCPGTVIGMTAEEIAAQVAKGVPQGKATFTWDDWHAGEVSLVFNGAIPMAGTAFATSRGSQEERMRTKKRLAAAAVDSEECTCCADDSIDCACPSKDQNADGECSCHADCPKCKTQDCGGSTDMAAHQEEPMYAPHIRAALKLAATATDDEVTAKITENATQLATVSADNVTLLADKKTAADAAFVAAWKGKLSDATVASLTALPNRDAMATQFAADIVAAAGGDPAAPPIGNPLVGAGLAAAPPTPRAKEESFESKKFRTSLGKFKTPEEAAKFATIGPIEAMEKWLSTSGTPVTLTREPFHENFERQTKDNRMKQLGLTS